MGCKLDYHVRMEQKKVSIVVAGLTLIAYLLTAIPSTKPVVNSLFVMFVFIGSAGLLYWPIARKNVHSQTIQSLYFLTIFMSLLMWVGAVSYTHLDVYKRQVYSCES